jgi:hypothetical protein
MLRDGQFVKEPPPKIGSHYVPQYLPDRAGQASRIIEQARAGGKYSTARTSRRFDVGAIMIAMYVVIAVAVADHDSA